MACCGRAASLVRRHRRQPADSRPRFDPAARIAARCPSPISDTVVPVRSGTRSRSTPARSCGSPPSTARRSSISTCGQRTDPRERFWAARTRQFYGTHVTTGHRLWSNLPFLRPMVTFIADTVGYGRDADDAGCHDLLGTRCDPYVNQLLVGAAYDFHCHSNLTRAVAQFGLTEFDVHDVINLFQVTGLMPDDKRYFMKTCPARPGDYRRAARRDRSADGDLAVPWRRPRRAVWGEGSDARTELQPVAGRGVRARRGAARRMGARRNGLPTAASPGFVTGTADPPTRHRRSPSACRSRSRRGSAMGVLLGIAAGILLGVSDFMANRASRTISSASVSRTNLAVSGLIAPAAALRQAGRMAAERPGPRCRLGYHAVGRPVMLYRGYTVARMGIVAPTASVLLAAVPGLWDLIQGNTPSTLAACGMVAGPRRAGADDVRARRHGKRQGRHPPGRRRRPAVRHRVHDDLRRRRRPPGCRQC